MLLAFTEAELYEEAQTRPDSAITSPNRPEP